VVYFGARFAEGAAGGFLVKSAGDVLAAIAADGLPLFPIHGAVVVALDVAEVVVLHRPVAVVFDDFGAVVFAQQIQVFLGVDVDLLFVSFVFKSELVTAFTLVGLGFQGGSGLVLRQRIRWRDRCGR